MVTFKGNIIDDFIESRFLQEKINLKTFLPNNHSPLYTYQLVIAQDGDDYLQKGKLASVASELLENKEINNCIIVMIPYQSIEDRYHKYHPNGAKNGAYIRFLAEELIPYLEKKYHTFELASGRTLLGDSLGGTVSLHAAFEYPYTFGQVIAQSPFIDKNTMAKIRSLKKPELLRLYQSVGKLETEVETTKGKVKDFLTPNREFHLLTKEKGIDVYYDEFNGDHTWPYWQKDLKKALILMLK
uniref:Enterochelin esterase n=1 Tax=Anaerobacillus isosaccharinicus TaxID=1532552 RepID=A0A1S2M8Q9_9BACI|nr:alpha/beta hydrolase-fold protein [Anaerobacillus isosaccharinicus]MBA5587599.1 esterase family protein [Anaerobacillus isosaccharinicus]QOY34224.1 esterase family protein [Anaerobacillus isosaccharinicus]